MKGMGCFATRSFGSTYSHVKMHCRYTDALALEPEALHKLYSNRSMAYGKANRFCEALEDAQAAIRICPTWGKGHWRLGMAHLGLKQHLLAVVSFARCWHLEKGAATCPSCCFCQSAILHDCSHECEKHCRAWSGKHIYGSAFTCLNFTEVMYCMLNQAVQKARNSYKLQFRSSPWRIWAQASFN